MSGPAAVPSGRGPGASQGSARSPAFTGPLLVLVALGLVLRLVLVILLPGSGFANDLASFQGWAANLAAQGPWGFYERPFFHDYTPGYLYVLWLLGYVGQLLGGLGDLVKLPAIVADLVNAWLVALMLRDLGASSRQALGGAALVLFLPITWFDSVVWGQVDSVGVVFVLLGLRALWQDRREWAAVWAVVAAVTKPQLGILAVVVAAVVVGRSLGIPWRRLPSEEWEESEGSAEEVAVALGARPALRQPGADPHCYHRDGRRGHRRPSRPPVQAHPRRPPGGHHPGCRRLPVPDGERLQPVGPGVVERRRSGDQWGLAL